VASFTVEISPHAQRDFAELSSDVAARITRKMAELERHPFPRGDTVKQLQGYEPPMYRLRIGDYRAIYRIYGTTILVLRVVHRSELDRALRDLV